MKPVSFIRFGAATLGLLLAATPAWAAAECVATGGSAKWLVDLLPLLFFLALIFLLIRLSQRRHQPYMDRAKVHMDRLEKQNEEIIALLREIAGKPRPPEPPAAGETTTEKTR